MRGERPASPSTITCTSPSPERSRHRTPSSRSSESPANPKRIRTATIADSITPVTVQNGLESDNNIRGLVLSRDRKCSLQLDEKTAVRLL